MIYNVKGNLLESQAQALVNTVNTVGVMGKGIALQFKEAFPNNFIKYKKACRNKSFNVGEMFVTEDKTIWGDNKIIINFPTKTHWRLPSEYAYISQGLKALRSEIQSRSIKSIAIPPLGSHNGGLDWKQVKPMIIEALSDLDCEIFLYEPNNEIAERMKAERIKLTKAKAMIIIVLADMVRAGEFASVFAAEKLIYFMQKFGAKEFFKIEFKPYIYGPYSDGKIAHLLYDMNGSYIKGMTGMNKAPFEFIWLTDDAREEAILYLENLQDERPKQIAFRTMDFLGHFYSALSLELLATIDFILTNNPSLTNWRSQDETEVRDLVLNGIKKMSSRKENLLRPDLVTIAINHLKTVN